MAIVFGRVARKALYMLEELCNFSIFFRTVNKMFSAGYLKLFLGFPRKNCTRIVFLSKNESFSDLCVKLSDCCQNVLAGLSKPQPRCPDEHFSGKTMFLKTPDRFSISDPERKTSGVSTEALREDVQNCTLCSRGTFWGKVVVMRRKLYFFHPFQIWAKNCRTLDEYRWAGLPKLHSESQRKVLWKKILWKNLFSYVFFSEYNQVFFALLTVLSELQHTCAEKFFEDKNLLIETVVFYRFSTSSIKTADFLRKVLGTSYRTALKCPK